MGVRLAGMTVFGWGAAVHTNFVIPGKREPKTYVDVKNQLSRATRDPEHCFMTRRK